MTFFKGYVEKGYVLTMYIHRNEIIPPPIVIATSENLLLEASFEGVERELRDCIEKHWKNKTWIFKDGIKGLHEVKFEDINVFLEELRSKD